MKTHRATLLLCILVCGGGALLMAAPPQAVADDAKPQAAGGDAKPQAAEPQPEPIKRGQFEVLFNQRSPNSTLAALAKRFPIENARNVDDYKLVAESFVAYVPQHYEPGLPFGLLVWISSDKDGAPPNDWPGMFDRLNMIYISANNAQDKAALNRRLGLAIDAAYNIPRFYTTDDQRLYVGGRGDGAVVATMLALNYPNVFKGGLFLDGAAFYRPIRDPQNPRAPSGAGIPSPPASVLNFARSRSRFAILAGQQAPTRDHDKAVYEQGYKRESFAAVTYMQAQGFGKTMPSSNWIERAIVALDAPLRESVPQTVQLAQAMEKRRKFDEAWDAYGRAAMRSDDEMIVFQAKKSIAALRDMLEKEIAPIRSALDEGKLGEAKVALAKARRQWGQAGGDALGELEKRLDPNAGKSANATNPPPAPAATAGGPATAPPSATNPAPADNPAADRRQARIDRAQARLKAARLLLATNLVGGYEALDSVARLYGDTPAGPDAQLELAQLQADPDKFDRIRQALADRDAKALLSLAKAYIQAGDKDKARQRLTTLLKNHPKHPAAIEAKLLLDQLDK